MCTAISFLAKDHYFGRNLDLDIHYKESITIMPRNYNLQLRRTQSIPNHYALIGIATVDNNYPLYYDATNEYGLSMAGLNFPENAKYQQPEDSAVNIAPFELIPWVLCQCKTVDEAIHLLQDVCIAEIPYSSTYPLTPLHWILSDRVKCITLEPMEAKLFIYPNPIGVLTNNPPFPYHLENLRQYLHLSSNEPDNHFSSKYALTPFSRGLGAIGLPGDFSSASRFVRAAFVKENSIFEDTEKGAVNQFLHILQCVQQPCGSVRLASGNERTIYSACCNTDAGVYYYTTYENGQITAVDMHREDLNTDMLVSYPLQYDTTIHTIN